MRRCHRRGPRVVAHAVILRGLRKARSSATTPVAVLKPHVSLAACSLNRGRGTNRGERDCARTRAPAIRYLTASAILDVTISQLRCADSMRSTARPTSSVIFLRFRSRWHWTGAWTVAGATDDDCFAIGTSALGDLCPADLAIKSAAFRGPPKRTFILITVATYSS